MSIPPEPDRFLAALAGLGPDLSAEADREDGFPEAGLAALRGIGALAAALPPASGGLDLGCGTQNEPAARFFRQLGRASVAIGRLIEAHVNALRLVACFGDPARWEQEAAAARHGTLFALWVTDGPDPLRVDADGVLHGGKAFCSGAGHAGRAMVTARDAEGRTRLYAVDTAALHPVGGAALSGVRGAVTADLDFTGLAAGPPVGQPGDYLKQPEFSAGAWRGSAVACGALEALVADTIAALRRRGHHRAPHQAARIGRLLILRESAIAWVSRAAAAADGDDPGRVAAEINLSRIAVETTCLEAIPLVQRALGLRALLRGSRTERVMRDLATYLRQPAPDETLDEAALWFAEREHGA